MDLLCFCSVLCLLCLCARLFICALWSPAGKGLTSWLSFVVSTMSLLYGFLIFAPLLTLKLIPNLLDNYVWSDSADPHQTVPREEV